MITHPEKSTYHQLTISLLLAFFFSTNTTTATENRIIHFPPDRSIGEVSIRDMNSSLEGFYALGFWEELGPAKGNVIIPANKAVRLNISKEAWQGSKPFEGLRPDDIQTLSFTEYQDANDSTLEDISTLSGLQTLDLSYTQILGTGLKYLEKFKNLRWLRLSSTHVGDNELAPLAGLESLEYLNLNYTPVSNTGMAHISKIKTLKSLYLQRTSVDDDGLEHIKNLTSLRFLDLSCNSITDEGLKLLAGLTELEEFDFYNTQISGAGLVYLQQMKNLRKLNLIQIKVSDEEIKYLLHLESLERLELIWTMKSHEFITEKGVEALAKLKSLEFLNIGGPNINNTCIAKFVKFPALKELWIQHSTATNEGLAELKNLKSLTKLSMGYSDLITGEGLTFLRELPNLVEFQLHSLNPNRIDLSCLAGMTSLEHLVLHTEIKDEDLACLPEFKNLKKLNIRSEEITDEGLRYLARQKSLETLILYCPEITDTGLAHLEGLSSLKLLDLKNTKVTEQGLAKLKEKIPALDY